jgi:acyl-CoA thioesterase FadM
MDVDGLGRVTLQARVERWQCDFNDHWNARFYVRTFQLAAEAIATRAGTVSPGARVVPIRHMRFHRELFANAPVEVRSAMVADGPHKGAAVHLLASDGRLAATALDWPAPEQANLPLARAKDLALALPSGSPFVTADTANAGWPSPVPLGPIRPSELDHTGALLWEELIGRLALTSHRHITQLGFTPAFVGQSGINRMTAEMRVERHAEVPVGTCLQANTQLVAVGRKSFSTGHRIESDTGVLLAAIRQNLRVVDLKTRRAVELPDFLRAALG